MRNVTAHMHGVLRPLLFYGATLLIAGCSVAPASGLADRSSGGGAHGTAGWTTVWRDGFTGPAGDRPSPVRWRYDTGTRYPDGPPGWGNAEFEVYTAGGRNIYLDGHGHLAIRPLESARGGWTSGRIETQRSDFQPRVGTSLAISARIRLPAGGQGYWPAFWMLGAPFRSDVHDWPAAGELDAMENVNNEPIVRGTLHCGLTAHKNPCHEPIGLTATYSLAKPAGAAGFHTYTVVWNTRPRRIRWYVDDRLYLTVTAGATGLGTWRSTFGHGYFILLNVAIGGRLPHNPTVATRSGEPMLVDDVTVARNSSAGAGPPLR